MELKPTSYVLLGTLAMGPRTGYEIKAVLDKSARFFWASSYGQIYPELKRLAEAGLIEGTDDPAGARRRIQYRITGPGREALRAWLREPPETFELRDEGLLKLFFSNAVGPEDAIETLRVIRRQRETMTRELEVLRPKTEAMASENPYPLLVLRAGIEHARLFARWCEETENELLKQINGEGTAPPTDRGKE